ncbi:MAG: hypothetical protein Tsb0015_09670 [Simkaniaceae bacterium]
MNIFFIASAFFFHAAFAVQNEPSFFRKYADSPALSFYRDHNRFQTLDFAVKKKEKYCSCLGRLRLGIWKAIEKFQKISNESDPGLDLPQVQHCLQTAEALRKDGHPRWLVLTGLILDLGKILLFFGEPQWAMVRRYFSPRLPVFRENCRV